MEMGGFEPPTCALRTHRSGLLSYIPIAGGMIPRLFQMFNRKSSRPAFPGVSPKIAYSSSL